MAIRSPEDLDAIAVKTKYKSMNTFYKYYNSEFSAPVLTLFIGGNHEASNHLQEMYQSLIFSTNLQSFHGGWVAPNIYYLGAAGVVNFGGLRIASISGIYKHYNYYKGTLFEVFLILRPF